MARRILCIVSLLVMASDWLFAAQGADSGDQKYPGILHISALEDVHFSSDLYATNPRVPGSGRVFEVKIGAKKRMVLPRSKMVTVKGLPVGKPLVVQFYVDKKPDQAFRVTLKPNAESAPCIYYQYAYGTWNIGDSVIGSEGPVCDSVGHF